MYESLNQEWVYLAGESMAVDVTNFARSCQDGRPIIIPNREEHLYGHRELTVKTSCVGHTYLGHNDNGLPRNVVFFECLPENTL